MNASESTPHEIDSAPLTAETLTPDAVLNGILAVARDGASETVRLRAWELLGRHHGLFADPRQRPRGPVIVQRLIPPLTDEPLPWELGPEDSYARPS